MHKFREDVAPNVGMPPDRKASASHLDQRGVPDSDDEDGYRNGDPAESPVKSRLATPHEEGLRKVQEQPEPGHGSMHANETRTTDPTAALQDQRTTE
jgi:hypothetical protein